jgi:Fe-S-cluster-containing dehydrogenase component
MVQWGMVIDLQKCVGCYACVIACKQEHFLPRGTFWGRLLVAEMGEYSTGSSITMPILCNHCKDAPCVDVCPTGATVKREDGIVVVDSSKCAGCGSCVVACPYQHRSILDGPACEYFPGQGLTEYEEMGRVMYPLEPGTAQKCNFCLERIEAGLREGLVPGSDWDATPACVITCPSKARFFGNLNDPEDEVSVVIREKKAVPFHGEFGTGPSVYYILR